MSEIENERTIYIDLEDLPDSMIYRLPEVEYTYSGLAFGFGEFQQLEYYENMFEKAFPGLLQQFPCLYYMVEDWHHTANLKTPLEEIEAKKGVAISEEDVKLSVEEFTELK
jgi:hypothetical protein